MLYLYTVAISRKIPVCVTIKVYVICIRSFTSWCQIQPKLEICFGVFLQGIYDENQQ